MCFALRQPVLVRFRDTFEVLDAAAPASPEPPPPPSLLSADLLWEAGPSSVGLVRGGPRSDSARL